MHGLRVNPLNPRQCVTAPSPRASLGRRTVCGRTEQRRPHGRSVAKLRLERYEFSSYCSNAQTVCVCSVWVPCVALPSGGRSSVGPSPLCGSHVWVPCAGPLCGSPVWVPSVWVPRRAAFHVASTRVMSPARSHAPAHLVDLGGVGGQGRQQRLHDANVNQVLFNREI